MLQTLDVQRVHRGRIFSVDVVQLRDRDGQVTRRDVVRHPGAVAIVGVLAQPHEQVVLIRNHRIAVSQALWEVPAGTLEPGEPPHEAARRELLEETGYEAAVIRPLIRFYTSPGFADELMHVFVAEGLEHRGQRLQPEESIEVHPLNPERALAMIDDGTIQDGKTIAALLAWNRARTGAGGARS
jgi:ADP-ribose pyrophosphatase